MDKFSLLVNVDGVCVYKFCIKEQQMDAPADFLAELENLIEKYYGDEN